MMQVARRSSVSPDKQVIGYQSFQMETGGFGLSGGGQCQSRIHGIKLGRLDHSLTRVSGVGRNEINEITSLKHVPDSDHSAAGAVVLAPDVAEAFGSARAVNAALRRVIQDRERARSSGGRSRRTA